MKSKLRWMLYIICIVFFVVFILGIVFLLILLCSTSEYEYHQTTDPWLTAYYCFSIFGSIGTLMAVIIALFKDPILKFIYSPEFKCELIDDGITEVKANSTDITPDAYECSIRITNNGSIAALGCKLFLNNIKFNKNSKKNNIKYISIGGSKQLTWASSNVDIPINIPNYIVLFTIQNPNKLGTPQDNQKTIRPRININGCSLDDSQSHQGYYVADYYLSCNNGNSSNFQLTINWDGTWQDSKDNIKDCLDIKFEIK